MQCTVSEMQTLFNYVYTARACITDTDTAFILWGYLKYFFYFHKLFIFITSFAVSACFKQMARRGTVYSSNSARFGLLLLFFSSYGMAFFFFYTTFSTMNLFSPQHAFVVDVACRKIFQAVLIKNYEVYKSNHV